MTDTDSVVVHVECEEEGEAASHPTNSMTFVLLLLVIL